MSVQISWDVHNDSDNQFPFISHNNQGGQIGSKCSHNLIRAHVMRNHWKSVKPDLANSSSSNSSRKKKRKDGLRDSDMGGGRDVEVVSPTTIPNHSMAPSKETNARLIPRRTEVNTGQIHPPKGHLQTALFSSNFNIPTKSYQYLTHATREFHVVFSDYIQPLPYSPVRDRPEYYHSLIISSSSQALLQTLCVTGATHEAFIHVSLSQRRSLFRDFSQQNSTVQDALTHKSEALRLLKTEFTAMTKRNTDPVTVEALLATIITLLAGEASLGNDAAIRAHTAGMNHLLDVVGGIDKISPEMAQRVLLVETKTALAQLRQPNTPLFPYLHKRFRDVWIQSCQSNGCLSINQIPFKLLSGGPGSGFEDAMINSQISHPTIWKCLVYTRHLLLLQQRINTDAAFQDMNPGTYSILDFLTLEYHLLSLPIESSQDNQSPLTSVEKCIQLSLLLLSNTSLWRAPTLFAWITTPRQRLYNILKHLLSTPNNPFTIPSTSTSTNPPSKPPLQPLLLWILTLGFQASKIEDRSTNNEAHWWYEELSACFKRLEIKTYPEAKRILEKFLWKEEVYGWIFRYLIEGRKFALRLEQALDRNGRCPYPCVDQVDNWERKMWVLSMDTG